MEYDGLRIGKYTENDLDNFTRILVFHDHLFDRDLFGCVNDLVQNANITFYQEYEMQDFFDEFEKAQIRKVLVVFMSTFFIPKQPLNEFLLENVDPGKYGSIIFIQADNDQITEYFENSKFIFDYACENNQASVTFDMIDELYLMYHMTRLVEK